MATIKRLGDVVRTVTTRELLELGWEAPCPDCGTPIGVESYDAARVGEEYILACECREDDGRLRLGVVGAGHLFELREVLTFVE